MNRFSACRAAFALAALVGLPLGQAAAAEFCVDTALELDAALEHFVDDNEDTVIRIAQGEYGIQEITAQDGADLTLSGGYTDGTCSGRAYDPALTVLRPGAGDRIDITAKNLSIGSITFDEIDDDAWFEAAGTIFSNGVLRLTRTRIDGPAPEGIHLLGERVYLTEALVTGSGTGNAFNFTCALNIEGMDDGDDIVSIQHSTIVNNPGSGVCIGDPLAHDDLHFAVWLDNNIFHGSTLDLEISATSRYVVRNNIIGDSDNEFGPADPGASGGTLDADPLFVDASGGDFRLQNASPAINSGRTSTFDGLPQLDIAGNTRWVGPTPDRGAYESLVDGTEVLTVTDVSDLDTPGTLRWALNQANANPNYSIIRFAMPGGCPQIILLSAELPGIVTPIGIDGYSQPGSSPNSGNYFSVGDATDAVICVRLGGIGIHYGLRVPPGGNGQLGVSGIALGGFLDAAISIESGTGSSIVGNEIFTGQPIGLFVGGTAEGTQIGGPDAWQKNVIRGSSGYNIALNPPSAHAIVENNLIGLKPDGNSANADNGVGVGISGSDNIVRDNAIAGNTSGIAIFDGDRNHIERNTLGRKVGFQGLCGVPPLPPCGDRDLANASHGVLIQSDALENLVQGNTIANSGGAGIRATEGERNLFIGNAIWNSAGLGVDLNAEGRDPIDNDGAPGSESQANRGLNAPGFVGGLGGRLRGSVFGVLSSTNGTYIVQTYVTPDCAGGQSQARYLMGLGTVTITGAPAGGTAVAGFQVGVRSPNNVSLIGQSVTAMVTELGGPGHGNTSELSICGPYEDDTIFTDGFNN